MKRKRLVVVVLIIGLAVFAWRYYRALNGQAYDVILGFMPDELVKYMSKDNYYNPDAWAGYSFGDPVPDAVKY